MDGVAGVGRVDHHGQAFTHGRVYGDGGDIRSGDHHLADFGVGEVEHLVDHLLLGFLDDAGFLSFGEDAAQLLLAADR